MSDDRELWIQAKSEYEKALAIATQLWTANADPAVLNAVTATLLIHHDKLRDRANRPAPQESQPNDPKCPECGKPTVRPVKRTDKSPDFKCSDPSCKADGEYTTSGWVDKKTGGIRWSKKRETVPQ